MSRLRPRAEASADTAKGVIHASVEIAASPERVFQALASKEIIGWWIRPGVFTTDEWTGDVRVGGRWRTRGIARGEPYGLEGEFLEIDPPRKLVFTWHRVGTTSPPTRVTCLLEKLDGGTRLTLVHSGFTLPEMCSNVAAGWQTSVEKLAQLIGR